MQANHVLEGMVARAAQGHKALAVLVDPDNLDKEGCRLLINACKGVWPDYFFVGGSLITNGNLHTAISQLKETPVPVVLFPGNSMHIDGSADALLFLSLISGRNPDLLIGQHVMVAPILKRTKLEVIPTGYMLIDGGNVTAVSYISNTTPIPADKHTIAACTAMAGEMLGLKVIYLDAGSGADKPVNKKMIATVKRTLNVPLIVGGGLDTPEKAEEALEAGADIVVVGNSLEDRPDRVTDFIQIISRYNKQR